MENFQVTDKIWDEVQPLTVSQSTELEALDNLFEQIAQRSIDEDWQEPDTPENLEEKKAELSEEAEYVNFIPVNSLLGEAICKFNSVDNTSLDEVNRLAQAMNFNTVVVDMRELGMATNTDVPQYAFAYASTYPYPTEDERPSLIAGHYGQDEQLEKQFLDFCNGGDNLAQIQERENREQTHDDPGMSR